jgi:hypothetical protein
LPPCGKSPQRFCTAAFFAMLIYTNAETGKEEDILLLLYSDNGTLTK